MSNYANSLYNDYEKEIIERKRAEKQNKLLKLRNDILESENQRLEKAIIKIKQNVIEEKEKIINEKEKEIEALKSKIVELTKELDLTKYERDRYLAKLNIDGTTAGIPTSQTPINKKKIIPNSRKKTDNKIGGQENHKKHKLEKFEDDEINEHEDIILEECPHCHSNNLVELESEITKDEFDYQIKIIKKRIHFKDLSYQQQEKALKEIEQFIRVQEEFNTEIENQANYISKLRQSILQDAIQGKLVQQDLNDEPASVLLERIKAEKEQLIKEGKIKKEKFIITDEIPPYNIPSSWSWIRWNEILSYDKYSMKRGPFGSALRKNFFVSKGIRVFEQYNAINDDPYWARYYITKEKYEELKAFTVNGKSWIEHYSKGV